MFDLYFILAVNKTKYNTRIFAYEKYNFHRLFYSNYIFMKIKAFNNHLASLCLLSVLH